MLTMLFSTFRFFFEPNWEKLKDITVWRKAAEQMFFSLSVSWGGLIMFGSYNKFKTRVHIHATLISSLDFVTSIIAGVVVFSILGHLSCKVKILRSVVEHFIVLQCLYPTKSNIVIS